MESMRRGRYGRGRHNAPPERPGLLFAFYPERTVVSAALHPPEAVETHPCQEPGYDLRARVRRELSGHRALLSALGSVWATSLQMSGSEDTEAPLRGELARRAGGPVTVEDYQVPIFELVEQQALTRGGHAVRLTRMQVRPSQVDDVIGVVGDIAVPSLIEAPGFCDALLLADPASGRLISETIWQDPGARAAAPSIAAIVRAEIPDEASSDIRAVEDYALVFSSMQEP